MQAKSLKLLRQLLDVHLSKDSFKFFNKCHRIHHFPQYERAKYLHLKRLNPPSKWS